jgi:cytidine kinase
MSSNRFKPVILGNMGFDEIRIGEEDRRMVKGGSAYRLALVFEFFKLNYKIVSCVGPEKDWDELFSRLRYLDDNSKGLQRVSESARFSLNYSEDYKLKDFSLVNPEIEESLKFILDSNPSILDSEWLHVCPLLAEVQVKAIDQFKLRNPKGMMSVQLHKSCLETDKVDSLRDRFKKIDFLFLTGAEACLLAEVKDEDKAVKQISKEIQKCVFLTKGREGIRVYSKGEMLKKINAPRSVVVDVTGAGDAFVGGALAGYSFFSTKDREVWLDTMLRWGTMIAGYSLNDYSVENILDLLK